MRILFALFLLILSFQVSIGQEKPKAELFAEIRIATCEDISNQISSFVQNVLLVTNSNGYFVIYANDKKPKQNRFYENLIIVAMYNNKIDENRYEIVQGENGGKGGIEIWNLLNGAKKPVLLKPIRIEPLDLGKPFIFNTFYDDGVCQTFVPEIYAELIKQNANINGHIVISNSDKKYRKEISDELLKDFTQNYNVPRNRLRVFFAENKLFTNIEYWLVPKKPNN
jgi:hypothetical protein